MASNTYVALQTVTASAASTVSFTSIPATYTDLRIVAVGTSTTAGSSVNNWRMTFNGDSTSGLYSNTALYGNGSAAASARDSNGNYMYLGLVGQTSNTAQPVSTFDIMNYANSTTNKTVIARGSAASDSTYASVGLWRNTASINRVDLFMSGATVTGTFTLYGIAAASVGAKATGGTIYQDASYFYHVFTGNGTFTPSQTLSCDYVIVAGGGGGGGQQGGGGGAGGLRAFSSASLSATGYTVTIGAGGVGGLGPSNSGATSGANTTFNSLSVTGGGYGAANGTGANAASGGSGGGGGINSSSNGSGNAGGYSPVEGYAGGATSSGDGGAGGGGAGGAGTSKDGSGNGKAGGTGASVYNSIDFSTWLTATGLGSSGKLAGGGGGGTSSSYTAGAAGAGGGGAGYNVDTPSNSAFSTIENGLLASGGGGGGGSQATTGNGRGGNGGSGVVIVRYAK